MGCGDAFGAICGLGCFLGISLVLQGAGLFSPRWATISITNTSSECYLGLVSSDCDDSTRESNRAVLGLQATSFAVILLTNIVSFINLLCCNNDDDDDGDSKGPCTVCLGCSVILYPMTATSRRVVATRNKVVAIRSRVVSIRSRVVSIRSRVVLLFFHKNGPGLLRMRYGLSTTTPLRIATTPLRVAKTPLRLRYDKSIRNEVVGNFEHVQKFSVSSRIATDCQG
ncbi:hypothetical protein FSP39_010309 [Pinctada imbricata]|uniref:Uncharacterized protein n=1 Tax=Pinctada imbricata TaxID=66713 RepID=A0AA88YIG4_PINIB|nr:hypothetical protein FSP39_010309 [Pinctada imbricata]